MTDEKREPAPPENENLRTRIAAVVENHDVEQEGVNYWKCTCGEKFYLSQDEYRSWQEHLADAVIRELQLGKEFGCGTSDSRHGCRCSHRYVTEWETAE